MSNNLLNNVMVCVDGPVGREGVSYSLGTGVSNSGSYGVSYSLEDGQSTSGYQGVSYTGYQGVSKTGREGVSYTGIDGRASAGKNGIIVILTATSVVVGVVGVGGILPDVLYKVVLGKLVPA